MKKNLTTTILVLTIAAIFSLGCGLLGGSKISNRQISDDLIAKGFIEKNGSRIGLATKYASHCFQVKDSKFTEDTGEINLILSATEILGEDNPIITVAIGDVGLSYKKDGEKWKLDKVNPTNFKVKTSENSELMDKFVPLERPICASYSRRYDDKN